MALQISPPLGQPIYPSQEASNSTRQQPSLASPTSTPFFSFNYGFQISVVIKSLICSIYQDSLTLAISLLDFPLTTPKSNNVFSSLLKRRKKKKRKKDTQKSSICKGIHSKFTYFMIQSWYYVIFHHKVYDFNDNIVITQRFIQCVLTAKKTVYPHTKTQRQRMFQAVNRIQSTMHFIIYRLAVNGNIWHVYWLPYKIRIPVMLEAKRNFNLVFFRSQLNFLPLVCWI